MVLPEVTCEVVLVPALRIAPQDVVVHGVVVSVLLLGVLIASVHVTPAEVVEFVCVAVNV